MGSGFCTKLTKFSAVTTNELEVVRLFCAALDSPALDSCTYRLKALDRANGGSHRRGDDAKRS